MSSLVVQTFTPIPVVIAYFMVAGIAAVFMLLRVKPKFTTLDLTYLGIGGAIAAVADHFIGDLIFLPNGIYPIVNPPVWFRLLVLFITVAVVRKVGSGIFAAAVFDLVGDIIHFGVRGEPLWLIEDMLTYGLYLDLMVYFTKGNIFGVSETTGKGVLLVSIVEGGILGFVSSFVHPIFTMGTIAPIVFGRIFNAQAVVYYLITYIIGNTPFGAFAGVVANRVGRLVSQTV
ncbi:hypothetical protein [Stygiolobus caldivivus]|uniref:Uncharacterized protein n=1 Tax=Stygiolobus caldivivus TaxID=2824673 RepID=A0A8D5U453_9CREN|nr:hypothetical protein [Stygiolobus caldivivus]BCU68929.1 hypothetical protein KN1_02260 [Stygiolobus caldivivus]